MGTVGSSTLVVNTLIMKLIVCLVLFLGTAQAFSIWPRSEEEMPAKMGKSMEDGDMADMPAKMGKSMEDGDEMSGPPPSMDEERKGEKPEGEKPEGEKGKKPKCKGEKPEERKGKEPKCKGEKP